MKKEINKKEQVKTNNEKLFGIKLKDIPKGHPLRFIYPNKFRGC
jgi:hypothetical protein